MHVPLTPIRCLYRGVDLYGRKIGVVDGEARFTYAEFGARCERLAAGLLALGIRPADRVAYLSFNNHQLLEGYFGVLLAGAIVMPLNVRLTVSELAGIIRHAEPRVLLFESDFQPMVEELRRACPAVEHAVEIGQPYEDLLARGRIPRPDPFSIDETAIAELFYTSGSTGTPKGVMLSHRTLYLHALYVANMFCRDDNGIELHTIPLFHANGWGRPQACTLMGVRHVMVRRFEPAHVLRLIEQERATGMSLVPTMANLLLNCPELERFDTSSLQSIMLGGAASSPELVERLERAFDCRAEAGYGLTESSPVATSAHQKSTVTYAGESDRLRRQAMTGWPMPGCEVRVVDLHMNEVPRDMQAVGEVVIRGDIVMDGYYEDPQAPSSTARKTSSSAAARIFRPSKWNAPSPRTQRCWNAPWSPRRTSSGAKCRPPGWCSSPAGSSPKPSFANSWPPAWPNSRCPAACISQATLYPRPGPAKSSSVSFGKRSGPARNGASKDNPHVAAQLHTHRR